jgi:hypothetical protein
MRLTGRCEQVMEVVAPQIQPDPVAGQGPAMAAEIHANHGMGSGQAGVLHELAPARQVARQAVEQEQGGRVSGGGRLGDPIGDDGAVGSAQAAVLFAMRFGFPLAFGSVSVPIDAW